MRILALDLSTSQTGWCIGETDGSSVTYGSFKPTPGERGERILETSDFFKKVFSTQTFDLVVAENIGLFQGRSDKKKQNLTAVLALAELRGAVEVELRRSLKFGLKFLYPATIRAELNIGEILGIKGMPKKEHVRKYVQKKGFSPSNDDESDAIAIFLAQRSIMAREQTELFRNAA